MVVIRLVSFYLIIRIFVDRGFVVMSFLLIFDVIGF